MFAAMASIVLFITTAPSWIIATADKMCSRSATDQVSKTTIAAAWVLRHPAKIQLITGTMNINRLDEIAKATEINLSREE
ncbi:MAG: aldo/keto reductase, partial [Alistipes sp.]|nr:aldo/keto reductase [Alistipes sp.]